MPRSARKRSESDIYHITIRGEGRQLLFENDDDRLCFMRMLSASLDRNGAEALAWCLMSNHVHLLVRVEFARMPRLMQGLMSGYAVYFNKEHDHVGHVFAGRYNSVPIDSDEYLMTVVRYIHFNPVKDGVSPSCEYRWSSYNDYLLGSGMTETGFVLEVFGDIGRFVDFHNAVNLDAKDFLLVSEGPRKRLADTEARDLAIRVLGMHRLPDLAALEKGARDAGIAELRRAGLSARQIERFTGIGRGIVERVKWR